MCFREKMTRYSIPQIFMEFYEIVFKGGQRDDVLFMLCCTEAIQCLL